MALYKRNKFYWIDITHNGARIQRSTGTSDKIAAQELHDKIKADLWRQSQLNEKPKRMWMEAALRWIKESSHKRSLRDDKMHLRWINPHFKCLSLDAIDRDLIQHVANLKMSEGVTTSTTNRMLALIRALLNKAANEWDWLDKVPKIKLQHEDNRRIRWLTQDESIKLISELPDHLADMATFTLATGLRQSNVKNLQWKNIDLEREHAWIHPDQAKGKKAIAIPLNETAMTILRKRLLSNYPYVFTYKGKPVIQVSTKAWYKALKRANIKDFRWHDLRHTWASWHVQSGTSLQVLQQLGGWSDFKIVLRYAHLSSHHLREAANRIHVTKSLQSNEAEP